MKVSFVALALALSAVPAAAQKVEVATGDWSALPLMRFMDLQTISPDAIVSIQRLVTSGQCELPGVSKRKIDMTVPFLVRFAPDGSVQHVVVRKLGCARAEGILAGAVLELVKAGTFKPTGENSTGWYRSELSFASS